MTATSRHPAKDRVAIASAATTGFRRSAGQVSAASMAIDACTKAIEAAGLHKEDIDGLIGANAGYVQSALGIPAVTYYQGQGIPFGFTLQNAVGAISSGQCEVVLAYHSIYRNASNSRSA